MDVLADVGNARPFLKWAGGKGQLISAIEKALPRDFSKHNYTYIEPFIGSGAVMFWMLKTFPNITSAVINDINIDLFNAYQTIKITPDRLIFCLAKLRDEYYNIASEPERLLFFLEKRRVFNERTLDDIEQTALLIFLNRTCFNGLYRVNSKNQFNVPFGKYHKPKICDTDTIYADSALLQKVTILKGDYSKTVAYTTTNTFFYFDPPYKPISKTSSFNSYSNEVFNDGEQIRLKNFCDALTLKNYKWLLSNSDPKNINPDDNFFDDLYKNDSLYIDRVMAKRNINANGAKRGEINIARDSIKMKMRLWI